MKISRRPFVTLSLLFCASIAAPSPALAEDGPVRQWLKERRTQQESNAHRPTDAKIVQPGDYTFTLLHGGLERKYRVHVPRKYDPVKPTPVLFALHGGGGNMDYQANDRYYGLLSSSEKDGFIAVFPNGYSKLSSGRFATWNAGRCCGGARDGNVDDVGFIARVVEEVTRKLNVDRNRVFATGMSNGGMMSYRLACELSGTFAGIAAVAGTDNTTTCQPKEPVSILHIHARNDDHVLFDGGAGAGAFRDETKITQFTSVPATISKWVAINRCDTSPKRVLDKNGAYCDLYAPCAGGTTVQLCVTETGGHSWPGGEKPRGETPSKAISANEMMWDYFLRR